MSLTNAQELFMLFFGIHFAVTIEKAHDMYKPWETYSAWGGSSHNIKRLLIAYLILVFIPLTHFGLLFVFIGSSSVPFDLTLDGVSNVILVSLSSLFEFGYFRMYEAFLHTYPKLFFTEEEIEEHTVRILPGFWSHFAPGLIYVLLSTILMLIAIYY